MKQYNGEKAIISLTSWKARINTVSKTLYSLIKQCPGFHIVLVLSEEEFPKKEDELPENLKIFINNDLIEVLWVYKNYKSFKKVLFTMDKYRDVPVISADDDCIYTRNYAQELYNVWLNNKDCVITSEPNVYKNISLPNGCQTLYPPNILLEHFMKVLDNDTILALGNDDFTFAYILHKLHVQIKFAHVGYPEFHDDVCPGNYATNDKVILAFESTHFNV